MQMAYSGIVQQTLNTYYGSTYPLISLASNATLSAFFLVNPNIESEGQIGASFSQSDPSANVVMTALTSQGNQSLDVETSSTVNASLSVTYLGGEFTWRYIAIRITIQS